jgi:hypothetical protein
MLCIVDQLTRNLTGKVLKNGVRKVMFEEKSMGELQVWRDASRRASAASARL